MLAVRDPRLAEEENAKTQEASPPSTIVDSRVVDEKTEVLDTSKSIPSQWVYVRKKERIGPISP